MSWVYQLTPKNGFGLEIVLPDPGYCIEAVTAVSGAQTNPFVPSYIVKTPVAALAVIDANNKMMEVIIFFIIDALFYFSLDIKISIYSKKNNQYPCTIIGGKPA